MKITFQSFIFTIAFLFLHGALVAQSTPPDCNYAIHGSVVDAETKQPIPYATILLQGTGEGISADEAGVFAIENLCNTEYVLVCSRVGYKPFTHHHDLHHGALVIYLAPSVSSLEGVVIEGEAVVGDLVSVPMETVDRIHLATHVTRSMAAAVSEIQGVSLTGNGTNVQLPVIHGLYGNRILVINQGVKHGFQNWGLDHAPEIDLAQADRLSILKGATGVQYGPEGLGGAVVVEGNPLPLETVMYGRAAAGYQTNGQGYHTTAQVGQGYERFSYAVGAKYLRIGDRHAPNYALTNTGKEEISANAAIRYHLPGWDFKLHYSFVTQDLGLLRSSVAHSGPAFIRAIGAEEPLIINDFSYEINEPRQNTAHHLANANIDWHTDLGKFSLLLSQQINLREEFDVRRNADLPIIDLALYTTQSNLRWDHVPFHGLEGAIGLQYFYQDNDNNPGTNNTPFIPNYNTNRVGAFVVESLNRGNIAYELGLRLDFEHNSVRGREMDNSIFRDTFSFANVTGSLGLVHEITPEVQLRVNLGSAWRTPNMAELYSFGQHGFKTQYGLWRYYTHEDGALRTDRVLTNAAGVVEPERGYKWINELEWQREESRLTLTAYAHLIDNFVFDRPVAVIGTIRGPMPVFIYDQTDALFVGTDLTYTQHVADRWTVTVGGSYLWSQNRSKNEPLINQPPANTNAELTWEMPPLLGLNTSKITLQASYTFRQFQAPSTVSPEELISGDVVITPESEIFDFTPAPEGYFLSHAQWQWSKGDLGGHIEVRNILNTEYRDYLNQTRYFADELGRNFLLSIHYTF